MFKNLLSQQNPLLKIINIIKKYGPQIFPCISNINFNNVVICIVLLYESVGTFSRHNTNARHRNIHNKDYILINSKSPTDIINLTTVRLSLAPSITTRRPTMSPNITIV